MLGAFALYPARFPLASAACVEHEPEENSPAIVSPG
jgi:hypothetical protein